MWLILKKVKEMPPSLLVLIFEMTARVRRHGGDVKIIHVQNSVRSQILNFNPFDYLSEMVVKEPRDPDRSGFSVPSTSGSTARTGSHFAQADQFFSSVRQKKEKLIPSRVDELYSACDFVLETASQMGFPQSELGRIKIAVYEACLNVIEHVYHSDPNQFIRLLVENSEDTLVVIVHDQGEGIQLNNNSDFDVVDMASNRRTGGMGLHIINRSFDSVNYEKDSVQGNRLVMVKKLK